MLSTKEFPMTNGDNALSRVLDSIPQAFFDVIARLVPGYLALLLIYVLKDNAWRIDPTSIGAAMLHISYLGWPVILGAVWAIGLIIDAAMDGVETFSIWVLNCGREKKGDELIRDTPELCSDIDGLGSAAESGVFVKMLAERALIRSFFGLLVFALFLHPKETTLAVLILSLLILSAAWIQLEIHIRKRLSEAVARERKKEGSSSEKTAPEKKV
jgi:hypothetical protein